MTESLPANPSITHLKKRARELQRAVRSGDPASIDRVRSSHPAPPSSFSTFTLRDAQLTIAREYGFEGWHQLNIVVGERMVDERDLHRWFGVQLNNSQWGRIEAGDISAASPLLDREQFLYSAFASAYHWRRVGTIANAARGEHLIARSAVLVGMPEVALAHARRCLSLVEDNRAVMADWDVAFALEALARAEAASGLEAAAAATLERAIAAAAVVADDEDRSIVQRELLREPWFGLR
jgi:hypothetical protein